MRITLYGFLNYDPTLFEDVVLPEDISKDDVVNEIIRRSGDLFPYHQALPYLKTNITHWFNRNYMQFEKMIAALMAEYDPIENYNRIQKDTTTPKEKVTEQHSGTDTNAHTGTISDAHTGTVTDKNSGKDSREITSTPGVTDTSESKVSAFDSSSYSPSEQTQVSHTGFDKSTDEFTNGKQVQTTYNNTDTRTHLNDDALTHGEKIETTNSGTRDFDSHIHGNIGVKSSQSMVLEELELRKFDIYTDIARRFEKEFLIQVY